MEWPAKDPDDVLDYSIDWSEQLEADGAEGYPDTISNVVWTVPAPLSKNSQTLGSGIATAWISGGEDGTRYEIRCRITTSGGRTYDRTVSLAVRQA